MISGNHFHPFPRVWLQRKILFSGNWIPVDRDLLLWPGNEFTFWFSLQFISGSHLNAQQHRYVRSEIENQRTHSNTGSILAQQHIEVDKKLRSKLPVLRPSPILTRWAPIQAQRSDPRTRKNELRPRIQCSDPLRSTNQRAPTHAHRSDPRTIHEPERTSLRSTNDPRTRDNIAPIHSDPRTRAPTHEPALWSTKNRSDPRTTVRSTKELRSSSAKRTPVQHFGHRPNHLSRWVFRHRFTVHTLTSPPTHTCPIHTLTSPVRSLHLFIYLFIYFYFIYYIF